MLLLIPGAFQHLETQLYPGQKGCKRILEDANCTHLPPLTKYTRFFQCAHELMNANVRLIAF